MRGLRGGRDEPGAVAPVAHGPEMSPENGMPDGPHGQGPRGPHEPHGSRHGGADGRRYEALGRVMAALSGEAEMLEACRDLTWWRGADHSWYVEWRDGPHAAEVAALLVERIGGPAPYGTAATPVGPATASTAALDVMGVVVVLRAIDPSGMERLRARPGLWRLSAALDGPVGAGGRSRQHWEELLGG